MEKLLQLIPFSVEFEGRVFTLGFVPQFLSALMIPVPSIWSVGLLLQLGVVSLAADDLSNPSPDPLPAPLHEWVFDEVTGDKSPDIAAGANKLDAQLINVTLDKGKFGQALNFVANGTTVLTNSKTGATVTVAANTNAYVTIPLDLNELAESGFTISFWVQADNQPQGYGTLFDSGRNAGVELRTSHDLLFLSLNHEWNALKSAKSLFGNDLAWTHVALSFGDSKATLYINGSLAGSHDITSGTEFWPCVQLGGYDTSKIPSQSGEMGKDSYQQGFAGKIDDLRIYRHVLTAAQVAQLPKSPQGQSP